MQEIIRLNFIDLIRKYKLHQTQVRIQHLTKTKKELRRRFFKLFKMFKKFKYGDADDSSEHSDVSKDYRFPEEIERNSMLINNQLKEIEKYLNRKLE